ncbi:MAG: CHAD domain-containing protein [Gammaproteobacteria bacterium]|nr:CHAD domain-containing protein [Gammaproteobacteria bacterium]
MKPKQRHWLDASPAVAARGLALDQLAAAAQARKRLRDGTDAGALHDFRVALRRLRSTIRLYRPWLDEKALSRKLRKRLKRLVHATNAARDAEVGLEWLRRSLPRSARGAAEWFAGETESRRQAAYDEIHDRTMAEFDALHPRLRAALRTRPPHPSMRRELLRNAIGDIAAKQIAALASTMNEIRSVDDADNIHAARIEAKRLRYLLEPLVRERINGKRCLQQLKDFQDRLGEFCDRTVLARELLDIAKRVGAEHAKRGIEAALHGRREAPVPDRLPALAALSAHVQTQRLRSFLNIRRQYLGERTEAFLALFHSLAQALTKPPRRRTTSTTSVLNGDDDSKPGKIGGRQFTNKPAKAPP